MRKVFSVALAAAACLGATLLSPVASANGADDAADTLRGGTPNATTPECRAGKIVIGFEGSILTPRDWYGLYNKKPNNANWRDGLVAYRSGNDNSGEWQWATESPHYYTNQNNGQELRTVYWTRADGKYEYVDYTVPTNLFCK
ncbi:MULTISPECIES: hypothetical protein [Streptomyces]|uniref:hypothetical protein n=1 Tax=Streptomyces TaxID=1883 RepID=UPI00224998A7|nr:hypothetical protein [Streptomyces sp. JHD 1]MCX2968140.1 hypothetical protein [Streptomyces sp. JHD 1]